MTVSETIGLRTLVLNADSRPMNLLAEGFDSIPVESAVRSVGNDLSVVVDTYNRIIRTPQVKNRMPWPSVIALKDFVEREVIPALTNSNLLIRDNYKCAYCVRNLSRKTLTWDHFIPRSLGGGSSWDNILASCGSCNSALGNVPAKYKTPSHKPYTPSYQKLVALKRKRPIIVDHESWVPFIGQWHAPVIVDKHKKKLESL